MAKTLETVFTSLNQGIQKGLQKYGFLLMVAVIVGATGVKVGLTELTPKTDLLLTSTLENFRAGQTQTVILKGEPNEEVELILTDTNQSDTIFPTEIDNSGKVTAVISAGSFQKSGTYSLSGRYLGKDISFEKSVMVEAGTASMTNSRVNFAKTTLENGESTVIGILLKDDFGNPVVGHTLTVTPDQSGVQVYTSEFATNEKGQMNFTVTGGGYGVVSFSIFDQTEAENILGSPALAFKGTNISGVGTNQTVVLASTGTVNDLSISGLSSQIQIDKPITISVKALDEEGITVPDYTGTVHFSSTDSGASLPEDYTFVAEDQGEHVFSLSLKLVTLGSQTITVTDVDNMQIVDTATTEVKQSVDASTDFNQNFETEDFVREGDFELVSPASGSYSTNQVEVQGEGEYGYIAVVYLNDEEVGKAEIAFDNSFSYTLQELEDGTYTVYTEIAKLNTEGEIESVFETSNTEEITIDTVAPELISITSDPETNVKTGAEVIITVLSEKGLTESSVVFKDEVYMLMGTVTAGKYQTTIKMPNEVGDFPLSVILKDSLGNESETKNALTLKVVNGDEPVVSVTAGLGQVSGLTTVGDAGKVILSWETPAGTSQIAFYRVYYGPSTDSLYATSETFDSATTWTIYDLAAGETYYFAVSAVDLAGNEGEKSMAVLGKPTSGGPQVDTTPNVTVDPNIYDKSPQTGPETIPLILLSTFSGLAYISLRKRA
ncbi:MAG: fibronectin type III domain-containing protein [Candidatus Gracilibacteria bacterium]